MKYLLLFLTLNTVCLQSLEYEVQLENELVKVAKVKIEPQEEIGLHRDEYPQIVIGLQGGIITRIESDGSHNQVYFPTNKAVFRSPDPKDELHKSINQTSELIEILIIQLKEKHS